MSCNNETEINHNIPPSSLPMFHSDVVAMAGIEKARCSNLVLSEHENNNTPTKLTSEVTAINDTTEPKQAHSSQLNQQNRAVSRSTSSGESSYEVSLPSLPDTSNVLSLVPQSLVNSVLTNEGSESEYIRTVVLSDSQASNNLMEESQSSETSQLLHNVLNDKDDNCLSIKSDPDATVTNQFEKHSTWRKLADGDGSYYWNIDTGATQYETPSEVKHLLSDDEQFDSLDSSLADLEGAAFRYASQLSDDNSTDRDAQSSDWTVGSDVGRMFSVQSLGWMPLDHFSANPETSSTEVNACIKHLSSSHSKTTDGVGAWGEGKSMMLLIEDEYLKLLDPVSQVVLQNQSIKHIRVWGVGGSSPHDFAYVAKDDVTRQYRCHVFRCDASAKAIAHELHNVCSKLSPRPNKKSNKDDLEKQQIAMSTTMPIPKSESITKFQVNYLGAQNVENINGIQTIKNVIREITTNDQALCIESEAIVSASALVINATKDNHEVINCRTRCLSFMGVGDDISLFAFINVVGTEAKCHVIQCLPNAAKLAHSVQEACMIRFQKAVDSRNVSVSDENPPATNRRSFKRYFKSIFTRKTHS